MIYSATSFTSGAIDAIYAILINSDICINLTDC